MAPALPDLVTPDWLAGHAEAVRLVDVREPWEYESIGHLPGAVSIPFDAFRAEDGDEGMLPGADRFAALMGAAGIRPEDTVVAYDDEHGVFAARFVVTARLYGHTAAHLLDGDYSAWSRDHPVTTGPTAIEPTEYAVEVPADRPLVEADDVAAAAADPDAVLVDTRTREEFAAGHIEGAVHLDWRALLDADTRGVKDRDALLETLADHGIVPEKRVVLYCNTARRISHTYLVLAHAGFADLGFYEGSLTDWRDRGLALVTEE